MINAPRLLFNVRSSTIDRYVAMTTQEIKEPVAEVAILPLQLVASIAALVFLSELSIMLAMNQSLAESDVLVALLNASALVAVTAPVMYFRLVRTFVERTTAKEKALAAALEAKDGYARGLAATLAQKTAHALLLDRHAIVSETDIEGRITYVNEAFLRATGYDRSELIGANYRVVNSGLHPPEFWREMYDVIADGGVWQGEICNKRKDGSQYWVQATNSATKDENGRVKGYVSVRLDITQSKLREQALQRAQEQLLQATSRAEAASEAKTSFLSTMSHEMRTPLNGVLGALDLLGETGLNEKQKELVHIAHECSDALLVHINDVLDFSKMEAGKLQLEMAPFELPRLVASVLQIVQPQAAHRGNQLKSELVGALPIKLDGDRIRVRQVLLNLVSNACKFTKNGCITLRVARIGGSDSNPEIEVSVADTGIGIPKDRLKDLFHEFSMVDSSYTRRTSGTGLGLAISKRLIEAMGGTIGAESTEGVGSRFWFRLALPGIWRSDEAVTEDARPAEGPVPKLRILLADDNVTNLLVAGRMLAASGHDVVTASNGREALEAVARERFDVLLTDISMPEMDGVEATWRIRQLPEPNSLLPIVAITANAISGDRERFLEAGMNEYLTKPLRRADLDACLGRMFRGKTSIAGVEAAALEPALQNPPQIAQPAQEASMPMADRFFQFPLLDPAELERLAEETSPEVVPAVVDEYLAEMQRRLVEVLAIMQSRDVDALQKMTHAIAGASASAGARRLREAAKRIELDCMADKGDEAFGLANDLPLLFGETTTAFRAHVSSSLESTAA